MTKEKSRHKLVSKNYVGSFFSLMFFFFLLLIVPVCRTEAQITAASGIVSAPVASGAFPQWAKDVRRWEIIAFGSFPFSMFTTTFFMDTYRWIDNNGMGWSEQERRYAPWPLKSAGAVEMTNKQHEMTLTIAAGLSAAIAFADFAIIQIKRNSERRRLESLPPGTAIILKRPLEEAVSDDAKTGEAAITEESSIP